MTLVRRGYRTPDAAREFLAADESHPPGGVRVDGGGRRARLDGDRRRQPDHRPRRLRRRRSLRDDDPGQRAARAGRGVRLADPRPDRRRVWPMCRQRPEARGAWDRAPDHRRLRNHLGRGGKAGSGAGHGGGGDRPSPTRGRSAGLPDPPSSVDGYPFAELCGTAVAWKLSTALRERAGSPGTPREREPGDLPDSGSRPRRLGNRRGCGPACRREPFVGAARPRGGAAGAQTRNPGAAGGGEMRADAARRGRSGVSAGAADQRCGAAVQSRCGGGAVPDRRRGAGAGDRG